MLPCIFLVLPLHLFLLPKSDAAFFLHHKSSTLSPVKFHSQAFRRNGHPTQENTRPTRPTANKPGQVRVDNPSHQSASFIKLRSQQSGRTASTLDTTTITYNSEAEEEDYVASSRTHNLTAEELLELPPGLTPGFFVVHQFPPLLLDDNNSFSSLLHEQLDLNHFERLKITPQNLTLPIALMLVDPQTYPSLSRARKACRNGSILVKTRKTSTNGRSLSFNDSSTTFKGRVGDRVYPGDVIARQVRVGSGYFPILSHKKPPFDLPVMFEDDYFALVNKPAGVTVYKQDRGGGIMTVRAALPFCLQPPRTGTMSVLRRPSSVHRLDKPTSGLLCVAKTKPARMDLSRQFHDRIVKKTYTAIVNGIPEEEGVSVSSQEAYNLGANVDPSQTDDWQLIDSPLDGKHAVTVWRALRYVKSLHAKDGYLTMVELKLLTGRFHQLRRHLSWRCGRAIVGDDNYDGGTADAMKFRGRGLFLCSNRITLEHPFYNSVEGRAVWNSQLQQEEDNNNNNSIKSKARNGDSTIWFDDESDKVMVTASVDLPDKFESLLSHEEERYYKFTSAATLDDGASLLSQ